MEVGYRFSIFNQDNISSYEELQYRISSKSVHPGFSLLSRGGWTVMIKLLPDHITINFELRNYINYTLSKMPAGEACLPVVLLRVRNLMKLADTREQKIYKWYLIS
jgi:hypothetical protein